MSTSPRSAVENRDRLSERTYLVALSALLVFAFTVRSWEIGRDSIWFDEGVSIGIARLPWGDFFRAWIAQVNSGLYYLLLRFVLPLGESETFLRLTTVACSVAAIAFFAEFTKRIFDRRIALLTAAFLSVNVNSCFYAREIRGYGLLLLLVAVAWLALERCLVDGRQHWFAVWAALWIAAMYVHMFSVMALGAQLCVLPLAAEFHKRRRQFQRTCLWIGFGYFPMALMIYRSHRKQIHWVPPLTTKTTNRFLLEYVGDSPLLLVIVAVLFAGACVLFLSSLRKSDSKHERFGLGVAVIGTVAPISLLALLSILQPAFIARYASPFVPTLALACAVAILRLPKTVWLPSVAVYAGLSLHAFRALDLSPANYEQRNDYRSVALFMRPRVQPGDAIATWGPQSRYAMEYYRRRQKFAVFPSFVFPGGDATPGAPEFSGLPTVGQLDQISREHKHIWLVLDRNVPYNELGIIPHFFLRRFGIGHRLVSEMHYRNATVYEFASD